MGSVGCFEYEETVWVEPDGRGRLLWTMTFNVGGEVPDEELDELRASLEEGRRELEALPEVESARAVVEKDPRGFTLGLDVRVHAFRDLDIVLNEGAGGPHRFVDLDDGSVRFLRALDDESGGGSGRALQAALQPPGAARLLGARAARTAERAPDRWSLRLAAAQAERARSSGLRPASNEEPPEAVARVHFHAPRIRSANPPGVVSRGLRRGAAVTWQLEEGATMPLALEAEFHPTRGWTYWLVLAAGGLLLLCFLGWFRSIWARGILRRVLSRHGLL